MHIQQRGLWQKKEDEQLKLTWTEDEFVSLGLDKYLLDVEELSGDKPQVRLFKCWIEDEWEREALSIKSTSNEILLRNKYGGVKYYNCDHGFEAGTIDRERNWYSELKEKLEEKNKEGKKLVFSTKR